MSDKKPIVLDAGQLEQLQATDDLDIPLRERVDRLETALRCVVTTLLGLGIELPEDVTNLME